MGEESDCFSILLVGFGSLDRGEFGQYQGSGRIGCANRRNSERALLLVHAGLGSPGHFLAELASLQCDKLAEYFEQP